MAGMAHFVLVHGAWHGSWCFRYLEEELIDRGHDVDAVDLPCEQVGLTAQDYAVLLGPRPDAIVVGHSLGAQTVALVPARLRVYLGGLLPVPNVHRDALLPTFTGTVRDDLGRSYWPDADACAANMYPDCTRTQSDWAFTQLRRQARLGEVVEPLDRRDVVIATMRDAAVDPEWQVRTAKANGARLIELDAGHSPFFTQPDELADLLDGLA
jgi:pimeloyl-ACP methyl ester carboxylesterase